MYIIVLVILVVVAAAVAAAAAAVVVGVVVVVVVVVVRDAYKNKARVRLQWMNGSGTSRTNNYCRIINRNSSCNGTAAAKNVTVKGIYFKDQVL
jgi:ABC-type branched-subunit amino acid transport system substrate-binding protein